MIQSAPLADPLSPVQRALRLGPSIASRGSAAQGRATQAKVPRAGAEAARAYLNLARGHLAAGHDNDAIQALRQATRLDPAQHIPWHVLGMALMRIGRQPDAVRAFHHAIHAKPDFAQAHHSLGAALTVLGSEKMAVAALRRAVALSPKQGPGAVDAHARIGTLLMSLSHRQEAIASWRRSAAAAPRTEIGQLSLAKALMAEERPEEAIAVLRRMLARDPAGFEARKILGDALSIGGQFEEAGQEYQRAIDAGPQPTTAYHSLVTSRKLTAADRPLIEGMRRLLGRAGLSNFQLMILHFALGKALDDLEDYEAAIEQFDAANRLRHRTSRLDRARLAEQFDGLIKRFTPEYFARHAALGSGDETPLLVLGMPRSGTTLTEQIISSHPAVVGGGELQYWLETRPPWETGEARGLTAENTRRLAEDYLTVLRDLGPGAARVTDKMPANFMRIGLIHLIFPWARIIHCKRDPVDICLSIYSTYFATGMDFAADRGDLVFFYRQYERLMEHWRNVLPPEILYETQYEELVADPVARSRDLIAFCGLEWNDACLAPELNDRGVRTASVWQVRQPVYQTPLARWRRYEPWLGKLTDLIPA
jgi:tetratricopeptide (TPR) repeat protein